MTRHDRRAWLQWVGVGVGDAAHAVGQAAEPESQHPAPGYLFFTAEDLRFLRAAVDRLLPQDKYPNASQAGVLAYIDRQLAGPHGQSAHLHLQPPSEPGKPRQDYPLGLTPAALYRESLDALAAHDAGRAFATRSPAQQDHFLRQLEAGHWLLKHVPSAVFFETLLANSIEAYFADAFEGGPRDRAGADRPPMPIATTEHKPAHRAPGGEATTPAHAP